ncbi:hypothetical protein FEM48_Zijuj09G0209600 [Ziziphus jujuba var. spinosa]|uniref:Complex III subunit VI n=2 Tax=Ziziphus jujuba TaxID=326968 RepID=A0A978UVA1_ZIZJJ|nr:hypothetical protein FEM48_Zijuj09G0209600 [Ziziphus jujuba var. spinosa]
MVSQMIILEYLSQFAVEPDCLHSPCDSRPQLFGEGSSLEGRLDISLDIGSMADEEPVDQKKLLEESCKPKCVKPLLEYQACVKRIQGDESGHKHCTGQYFDYWSCVDKCVAPKLFSKLK